MPEITPTKHLTTATWDDVPHLSEQEKADMLASVEPHLRDARSKGVPSLGSGAIYPIPESEIICDPFPIPSHFPVAYGFDTGWNKTAALWGAWDRESDIIYLWSEHYQGQVEPAVHVQAIMARAQWITGVFDYAARGRIDRDGRDLAQSYEDLGLNLVNANKSVEAGLEAVRMRLSTGRLKIFNTLQNTLAEYRIYRRDEKGRVVKAHDHLMDCLRMLIMGLEHFDTKPLPAQRHTNRGPVNGY